LFRFVDLAAWLADADKGGADDTIQNQLGHTAYDGID
jgi:hypothetical protein